MNGNGHGIPIVGQVFTLIEVSPTVVLICNCEAKRTLVIGGMRSQHRCPGCGKVYQIAMAHAIRDPTTGKLNSNANIVVQVPRSGESEVPDQLASASH